MKKNFKNKSIKILITSLLCGLTFTYINVSAMKNNDSKGEKQQSQEINNNKSDSAYDLNHTLKMQDSLEQESMMQKNYDNKNDGNEEKKEDIKKETNAIIENKEENNIKKINSNNEGEQQQSQKSNTKSNSTYDLNHLFKIDDSFEQEAITQKYYSKKNNIIEESKKNIENTLKTAQNNLNRKFYKLAWFWIEITRRNLKNISYFLDEETKKYYEEEIAKLTEEIDFNEKKNEIIDNLSEYSNLIYGIIHGIHKAKTQIERDKKIDLTKERTDYIASYIESNKKYLDDDENKAYCRELKYFYSVIEKEIVDQFEDSYKATVNYLKKCDETYETNKNNKYFDNALNEMGKIYENREKNTSYLSKESRNEIDNKIKEIDKMIKNSIKKEKVNISFETYIKEIPSLIDSAIKNLDTGLLGQALQKIEALEEIIKENFGYLTNNNKGKARIIERDNQIEIWKDEIKTNNETIPIRLKRN